MKFALTIAYMFMQNGEPMVQEWTDNWHYDSVAECAEAMIYTEMEMKETAPENKVIVGECEPVRE